MDSYPVFDLIMPVTMAYVNANMGVQSHSGTLEQVPDPLNSNKMVFQFTHQYRKAERNELGRDKWWERRPENHYAYWVSFFVPKKFSYSPTNEPNDLTSLVNVSNEDALKIHYMGNTRRRGNPLWITQWHASQYGPPPIGLTLYASETAGNMKFAIEEHVSQYSYVNSPYQTDITYGQWHTVKLLAKWEKNYYRDTASAGYWEFYLDNKLIWKYSGQTIPNANVYENLAPAYKFGIYNPAYRDSRAEAFRIFHKGIVMATGSNKDIANANLLKTLGEKGER
jgi:hypothetical protein